jgi:hypothetical protein
MGILNWKYDPTVPQWLAYAPRYTHGDYVIRTSAGGFVLLHFSWKTWVIRLEARTETLAAAMAAAQNDRNELKKSVLERQGTRFRLTDVEHHAAHAEWWKQRKICRLLAAAE